MECVTFAGRTCDKRKVAKSIYKYIRVSPRIVIGLCVEPSPQSDTGLVDWIGKTSQEVGEIFAAFPASDKSSGVPK